MKIASSEVTLASERSYTEENSTSESLTVWVGNRNSNASAANSSASSSDAATDRVSISIEAGSLRASLSRSTVVTSSGGSIGEDCSSGEHSADLLQLLIEALTGRKINLFSYGPHNSATPAEVQDPGSSSASSEQTSAGWGVSYDFQSSHYESETTTVNASGIIKTSDGRELSFSLGLTMDRAYLDQESVRLRAGDAVQVDPLVINFGGTAADLTDTKFAFDLDMDGETEDISFVTSGSGFLVLDKNGDGEVNDGSELFGPQSGNGFSDLAVYDSDNNGWIDENDAVFQKLEVWTKDAEGNDTLSSLQSLGIGAIYLGSTSSEFSLNNADNESNGEVSRTGIYVEESGAVKTIQQVDLSV